MAKPKALVKAGRIQQRILLIRGEKVIIDADLAEAYGVMTKALNQAICRNANRFPPDFMFRLTKEEKQKVVTNCDHLANLRRLAMLLDPDYVRAARFIFVLCYIAYSAPIMWLFLLMAQPLHLLSA